ncbi:MAG: AraC family transcriptional regulator [Planctomycetes bacterium]|nr:AraC family transcriptional regulator [Planctomycetota bacterium]
MPRFLSIGRIERPIRSFPSHQHKTWELVLYTHGKGTATIGGEKYPFRRGTIICMPPDIPHSEDAPGGYRNFYIHTEAFDGAGKQVPVFQDSADRRWYRTAVLLRQEFHAREPGWEEATQDLFGLLLYHLERWRRPTNEHPIVAQLKAVLVERMHDSEFRVGTALRGLPMAPDHLRRVFTQAAGRTPGRYLAELRVAEARRLLNIGGFSVKEVAVRVGLPDPYYFSRVFHKVTGVRPSAFGKQGRGARGKGRG